MIRHALLDADGVLQHLPGGFLAALESYLGDRAAEFLTEAGIDEQPCLLGQGDFRTVLGDHLATNQEAGRASYMRHELAYDDLFDESFYSCDLGSQARGCPRGGARR